MSMSSESLVTDGPHVVILSDGGRTKSFEERYYSRHTWIDDYRQIWSRARRRNR
jgi:hypothetical protein